MKKVPVRLFGTITAGTVLLSTFSYVSMNNTVNADSYRTDYTVYGDLNKDNVLDTFDLILLRKKINNKEYDKESDLDNNGILNENDLLLLSDYLLGIDTFFTAYLNDDADKDGLCDLAEIRYYNTDPDNSDTDGDELPDYYEITNTLTDPNNANSCDSKVNDGDYDSDFDTISNKEEYKLKTNPLNEDSDYDNLTDDYEINISKTDPISPDTDKDNINDGDEIKLGLNPNAKYSDGTTNDGEIITYQEISADSEVLSNVNSNNLDFSLSLEIDAAGYAENSVKVHSSKYRELLDSSMLIGEPIEISYNDRLPVKSININFNLNNNISENSENYMIFRFFPKTNYMLPVETKYEGGKVWTDSDKTGIFCLIDVEEYKKVMEETGILKKNSEGSFLSEEKHEVLFILDLSKSLDDKIEETKTSIRDFCDLLFSTTNESTVSFAAYYGDSSVTFQSQKKCRNLGEVDKFLEYVKSESKDSNIMAAMTVAQQLSSSASEVFSDKCVNKHIFIISDSDYNHKNSNHRYDILVKANNFVGYFETIKRNNVDLNFILASENYTNRYTDYLINLCDDYGFNVYSRSMLDNFTYCVYNDVWGNDSTHTFCMAGSLPLGFTGSINRNVFIAGLPDGYDTSKIPSSDSDGNINIKDALQSISNIDENGNFIGPKLFDECDESLATARGISQFKKFFTPEELFLYYGIPLTNVVINQVYTPEQEEGIDLQYAFTKGDKKFYYPKTFYPDLYTTSGHQEGINGNYNEEGKWIDWH